MTLVLKSNQKFTGTPIGDINGASITDWRTMINFADKRFVVNASAVALNDAITFSRTSPANYIDSSGNEVAVPINTPRLTNKGLLIESAANNLLINSDAPASQQVQLVKNKWYVYRVFGAGTINVTHPDSTSASGAVSQGKLGFIVISADVTKAQVTLTGVNSYAQLSQLYAAPSVQSKIHTTDKVVGRDIEVVALTTNALSGLGTSFTVVFHVSLLDLQRIQSVGATNPFIGIGFSNGANISVANTIAQTETASAPPTQRTRLFFDGVEKSFISTNDTSKSLTLAVSVTPTSVTVAKNGVISGTKPFVGGKISSIDLGRSPEWTGSFPALDGNISHFALYDYAMTDSQLSDMSTSWV